jgi:hypothetical protein
MRSWAVVGGVVAALACVPGALAFPPSNDAFSTPHAVGGTEGTSTDTNADATKEPGEPPHAGDSGGASVWYTWTAPRTGVLLVDTCDTPALDTLLAIYTGTTFGSLTPVASNDDACGTQSAVELEVVEGVEYRIAVDGKAGAMGPYTLWWGLRPANDDFANAAPIAGESGSAIGWTYLASHEPDEPFHAGEPGGGSVWFRWTAPRNGRLRLNTCSPGSDTLLGVYTGASVGSLTEVAAVDDGCGGGGLGSDLAFDAFSGTVYSIAVDSFGPDPAAFNLAWNLGILIPRNLSPPTLAGPAVENGVMTATPGTWQHANSYTYSWWHCPPGVPDLRGCTRIREESGTQLIVPTQALGRQIRFSVIAHGEHTTNGASSAPSATVGYGPPVNDEPPSIGGDPRVGEALWSGEGAWRLGTPPRTSITFLWQRCNAQGEACADRRPAATDRGLLLTAADLGSRVRVVVTVTTAGGSTSAASAVTDRILPAFRRPRLRTCSVPRVVGRRVARARTILRRSRCRFQLRVARRMWSARATGVIVRQTPRAGRRLRSGGRVTVVVSLGRRR